MWSVKMNAIYFFIDGSALGAQIRQLQRAEPKYRKRLLCPAKLLTHFMFSLRDLHGGSYKRATFYFPTGDEVAIREYIQIPDHQRPGEVRDLHFKFCGHKLKNSAEFDRFIEEKLPAKFNDRVSKSEKGIDIEMCCDALRLASAGKVDRLFLLTNDGDFIPLCRTIKEFGANVSIIHLSKATSPNIGLLREADSYDIVAADSLDNIFSPPVAESEHHSVESVSEKPEAEPSDLGSIVNLDTQKGLD
jgi:hypothetical protein